MRAGGAGAPLTAAARPSLGGDATNAVVGKTSATIENPVAASVFSVVALVPGKAAPMQACTPGHQERAENETTGAALLGGTVPVVMRGTDAGVSWPCPR